MLNSAFDISLAIQMYSLFQAIMNAEFRILNVDRTADLQLGIVSGLIPIATPISIWMVPGRNPNPNPWGILMG